MSYKIEEPIAVTDGHGETTTTHPAFGQIVASRVQGGAFLYGSDFLHHNYIEIRIVHSELKRNLNRDWHFGRDEIVSVKLSEAQWAAFVSAMNVGSGIPCTLDHVQMKRLPGLPPPTRRTDQFNAELKKDMGEGVAHLKRALAEIDAMGLSKPKADKLKDPINASLRALTGSLPFVAKSFSEHMETEVEKAKTEIHGYMTSVVHRAGMDAITGGHLPLQIEAKRSDAE